MSQTVGYAAKAAKAPLEPFTFERRAVGASDVLIDIDYCGVCHSDIHETRNEWGGSMFPLVPGHEIVGRVSKVGSRITQFRLGETVAVGCMVDSCKECDPCHKHEEQYCEKGMTGTYNSLDKDGKTPTYGGYSKHIVVDEKFVFKIPDGFSKEDLPKVAPLLCAGITTYSPLKHWKVGPGQRVGIIGLGGLGHMGVKLASAMGAHTVVITHSKNKEEDAKRLGAKEVLISSDLEAMKKQTRKFDFLLNTVSAHYDIHTYINLLKLDGTLVLVGVPEEPFALKTFSIAFPRRNIAGSLIGGTSQTQEMLDFCAKKGITSDVEVIPIQKINEAYERMMRSDVRYRFVIDMNSL